MLQYANIDPGASSAWTAQTDVMMPIVRITSLPSTWVGVLFSDKTRMLDNANAEFCDNTLHPETAAWGGTGTQGPPKSLKFIDPCVMMDWIDNANNSSPVNRSGRNKQSVKVLHNVPIKTTLMIGKDNHEKLLDSHVFHCDARIREHRLLASRVDSTNA